MDHLGFKKKFKYDLKNYKFLVAVKLFNYEFLKLKMFKKNKIRFVGNQFTRRLIIRFNKMKKKRIRRRWKWKSVKRKKFWKTRYRVRKRLLKHLKHTVFSRCVMNYETKYKYNKKFYSVVHVRLTYNNIFIVVTKANGEVLFWATSGVLGFKGSKKHSFIANLAVARHIYNQIKLAKLKNVKLVFKGHLNRRRLRTILKLFNFGFKKKKIRILSVINLTPISYNGCRKQKKRR